MSKSSVAERQAATERFAHLLLGETVDGHSITELATDPSKLDAGTVRGIINGAQFLSNQSKLGVGVGAALLVDAGKVTQAEYADQVGVTGGYVSQIINAGRMFLACGGQLPSGVTPNNALAAVKTAVGKEIRKVVQDAELDEAGKRKALTALVREGVKIKREQTAASRERAEQQETESERRGPRSSSEGNNGRTGEVSETPDRSPKTVSLDALDAAVEFWAAHIAEATTQDRARIETAAKGLLSLLAGK